MHLSTTLLLAITSYITSVCAADNDETVGSSSKRGLVFVPNSKYPSDNQVWVQPGSDLSWYYNYGIAASPAYSSTTQEDFEFVPMLWGTSTTFLTDIKSLVATGRNVTHVLTYNEPDGTSSTGGSAISPSVAAANWISQVEPLRALGIKTGAPAVTGSPRGITWLSNFFSACATAGTNCTVDFIPLHWYGNFEGLASFIGEIRGTYPNTSIWLTEYALNDQPLPTTQDFFNTSAEYFDRLPYVDRYSYFGSFRSSVSNVGYNATMLDQDGQLTDIGSWYLGGKATGNVPEKSAAGRVGGMGVCAAGILVLLMGGWLL
ncbi:hypothetical protein BCIN_12g04740 [Botrytis cinerea B05.10]|uniref:Asl1-like glycosyl hydrolase catalytic domain-containing protein n=3 Tax=Botryotinia fuckeliana TaxID=40559 RepID=A0A384JZA1_BOTFB|nr:hypothetical protein BCIN_12g04740 [Botrytis cinerea B05.10]ATZ55926.1 hypothetical protein BCIN_12g04740 [Botrytis cinerea B05.10]CCD52742.1 hypothetical protein BofuT4_P001890.1 [Botrytis cinerea T4]